MPTRRSEQPESLTADLTKAFESGDEHGISAALEAAMKARGKSERPDLSDLNAILATLNELGIRLTVKPAPRNETD